MKTRPTDDSSSQKKIENRPSYRPSKDDHLDIIQSEAQVFLVNEDDSSSTFLSLDPCQCGKTDKDEATTDNNNETGNQTIPEFLDETLDFVQHSRAISLPSSATPMFEWERSASFGQPFRNAFLSDGANTSMAGIDAKLQTGGTLALDTFVRASSYHELGQSPAVTFLGEIAELTAPPLGSRNSLMLPVPFQQVDGYVFVGEISSGTFSECWLGHPTGNASHLVAIKVFLNSSPDAMREIGLWSTFDHPNLLPLLDCFAVPSAEHIGTVEGHPHPITTVKRAMHMDSGKQETNLPTRWYAVSPLVAHGSLLTLINRHGTLPLSRGRHIFTQVTKALQYLHNTCRVVHGDVKLENILIDHEDRVYLCDFGLCQHYGTTNSATTADDDDSSERQIGESRQPERREKLFPTATTTSWHCTGSLQYCAPELFAPATQTTQPFELARKSDCWSLGVVLYTLVRGEFPFGDEFVPRLKMAIAEGKYERTGNDLVDDLLEHLLCVDPDQRWGCNQVLEHAWLKLE